MSEGRVNFGANSSSSGSTYSVVAQVPSSETQKTVISGNRIYWPIETGLMRCRLGGTIAGGGAHSSYVPIPSNCNGRGNFATNSWYDWRGWHMCSLFK